jgi:hypothetical protein
MKPQKIPKAVQTCQLITRPPRTLAGTTSAEKTGTVTSFRPMPTPRSTRQMASWPQFWVKPEPIGARSEKIAAMKMVHLRPTRLLIGSIPHVSMLKDCMDKPSCNLPEIQAVNKAIAI